MTETNAFHRLRGEMADLAEDLRSVRLDAFVEHAGALESRLPELLAEVRADGLEDREETARALRGDMLRLAALLESVAAYARARLSLEQRHADSYGPAGTPRPAKRMGRTQEA